MEQLREKIQEVKDRINLVLDDMLEVEEDKVYTMLPRLTRLHYKLQELSGDVERVIRNSFK